MTRVLAQRPATHSNPDIQKLRQQGLERRADQMILVGGDHFSVFVADAEVPDFVHGHQLGGLTRAGREPARAWSFATGKAAAG